MPIININTNSTLADILANPQSGSDNYALEGNSLTFNNVDLADQNFAQSVANTAEQNAATYADTKVADSITNGVTTIAPSQNAVFDALALKQDKVSGVSDAEIGYLDGVTSSIQTQLNANSALLGSPMNTAIVQTLTGTTAETVIPITCPNLVGVLQAGHVLNLIAGVQATNSGDTKIVRFYISDKQDALLNEVLIGTGQGTTVFINTGTITKLMAMTSISTQNIVLGTALTTQGGPTMGTTSIDFSTGTKYIVITFELANSANTMKLQWSYSQINRKF